MIHGVRPGPTFLLTNSHWLYEITVALFLGGILFVIIGTYAGKGLVRMFVNTPRTAMAAIVGVLCVLGSYAANININDIFLAFFFGVLGTVMIALGSCFTVGFRTDSRRRFLDVQFRRALMAGKGSSLLLYPRSQHCPDSLYRRSCLFSVRAPYDQGKKEKERTVILD